MKMASSFPAMPPELLFLPSSHSQPARIQPWRSSSMRKRQRKCPHQGTSASSEPFFLLLFLHRLTSGGSSNLLCSKILLPETIKQCSFFLSTNQPGNQTGRWWRCLWAPHTPIRRKAPCPVWNCFLMRNKTDCRCWPSRKEEDLLCAVLFCFGRKTDEKLTHTHTHSVRIPLAFYFRFRLPAVKMPTACC